MTNINRHRRSSTLGNGDVATPGVGGVGNTPGGIITSFSRSPGTLCADLLSRRSRAIGKAPDVWLFAHFLEELIGGAPDAAIWDAAYP